MIRLVDSSAWIDFMRGGETRQPLVAHALRDASAAFTQPVWAELWSGARTHREDQYLLGLRANCRWLELDNDCWALSYDLRRKAIRAGLNCPMTDVLIVACARRYAAVLLHADKHMPVLLEL